MDLEEVQATWKEYDRKLDAVVQLNRKLLNADTLTRARSALRRQKLFAIMGVATNAIVIPIVGMFIAMNHGALAFVLPALAIDAYFIGNLAVHARQVQLLSGLDYSGPVSDIQRRIDEIVRLRIRFARWLAMSMVLMWAPISIVLFKAFLGWNLYAMAPAWLIANTVAGLCVIPLVIRVSRKVSRGKMTPPAQRFLREVAGDNLTAANTFLNALAELEHPERPQN